MIPIKSLFNIPIKYCLIARKYLRFTKKKAVWFLKVKIFGQKSTKVLKKTLLFLNPSTEDSSKIGHDCRK